MKKMIFFTMFILFLTGFSEVTKLDTKYNKNSVWSICPAGDTDKKDCGIVFKGNPYKEFEIVSDPHEMYIQYKDVVIVSTTADDLVIIETKYKSIPKKAKLVPLDKELKDASTIAVGSDSNDLIAFLPQESFNSLKVYGKNVYYYNLVFLNRNVFDGSSIN